MGDWHRWIRPELGVAPEAARAPVVWWWAGRRDWWARAAVLAWYAATLEDQTREGRSLVKRTRATAIDRYEAWGGLDDVLLKDGREPVGRVAWPGGSKDAQVAAATDWRVWPKVARKVAELYAANAANVTALGECGGMTMTALKKVVYMTEVDLQHIDGIARKEQG